MWNPFKKPPYTREAWEKAASKGSDRIMKAFGKASKEKLRGEIFLFPPVKSARKKNIARLTQLRSQSYKEALDLENKYQKLLEDLEEARKAGQNVEEKEEAVRDFEEKELGMKVDRSRYHHGPYR